MAARYDKRAHLSNCYPMRPNHEVVYLVGLIDLLLFGIVSAYSEDRVLRPDKLSEARKLEQGEPAWLRNPHPLFDRNACGLHDKRHRSLRNQNGSVHSCVLANTRFNSGSQNCGEPNRVSADKR